jgi:hypothetical protein
VLNPVATSFAGKFPSALYHIIPFVKSALKNWNRIVPAVLNRGIAEACMPGTGSAPGIVPYGADQTVYLVVDSFGSLDAVYREAEFEIADFESVIGDLLSGRFNNPVRVIAFNTLEHWTEDVSAEVAAEIQSRCDIDGEPVPEHVKDFVNAHGGASGQLALPLI